MTNAKSVSPIAKIKPRTIVAEIPCPRPGCGGTITMTAGDKGTAWGTCKKVTPHVGKTGRANVCGTPVSFTALQTRALLEGKPHAEKTAPASPPPPAAAKPAASSGRRVAAAKRPVAGAGDGGAKPRAGNDPSGAPAKRRVGFFEY